MPAAFTTESLRSCLPRITAKFNDCAGELNSIDGKLGDGDIGITMSQGLQAVAEILPDLPPDAGMALMQCAKAFVGVRASSFGTLLATGLMSAAKSCKGREEVPWQEVASLIAGAVEAMAKRGRSALGEKTVLDVLDAVSSAAEGLDDPDRILRAAADAIARTLDEFRSRPSRQGRARIFADRSIGLDDPGQVVIKRLLETLIESP